MSDTDARMAFERHATSKIREANDLFSITTMGFRGEALASIAAVAQVELKTRTADEEIGTKIEIAGSSVISQEPVQCASGTQILVKNLFFNIPARRRFLKRNSTELRNIINEFQRIALANPHIDLSLYHNDVPLFVLPKSNYRQRIVHLVGKSINSQLINVDTQTPLVTINGFIGKPATARKKSGDQFFFVNNRYMRHPYFHKAVMTAYDKLLPEGAVPAYFLFLEVDPEIIDVNIHPTKTEIKFEDEPAIWHIISAAVRESLGKNNIVPSIDFDTDDSIKIPVASHAGEIVEPVIEVDPTYNPFEKEKKNHSAAGPAYSGGSGGKNDVEGWEQLYAGFETAQATHSPVGTDEFPVRAEPVQQTIPSADDGHERSRQGRFFQLKNKYILTTVKSGLMLIDQKRAHERILYERFMDTVRSEKSTSQKTLFPEEVYLNGEDAAIVRDIMDDLNSFGLHIDEPDQGRFMISGLPGHLENITGSAIIDGILADYKTGEINLGEKVRDQISASMARKAAVSYGKALTQEEMMELFDQLFACSEPSYSPFGKPVVSIISNDDLEKLFV
jgi:DNA mismatch repair protein MutL